jgi:prepilin-type processing-associated H-X9-DG protein
MSRSWLRGAVLAGLLAGLAVLGWQGARSAADEEGKKGALPIDLVRVPARSLALVSVRFADVWATPLAESVRSKLDKDQLAKIKEVEAKTGLSATDFERATVVMKNSPDAPPLLFLATRKPFDRKKMFALTVPGGKEEKYGEETIVANEQGEAGYVLADRALVLGPKADIQTLIDAGKEELAGGLVPALALAAKKHSMVIGINPSVLSPIEDELPPLAAPFKPLFKATSATLAIDLGDKITAQLHVAFPGAGEATEGAKAIDAARKVGDEFITRGIKVLDKDKRMAAVTSLLGVAQKSLKAAKIEREDSGVVSRMEAKIDQATVGGAAFVAVLRIREAAQRAQGQNNLKQLGLAMHNYLSANNTFPANAIYDKDGKALLSWRVMILPYIEQDGLYKEFRLDEAWDSPHNKKLLAKMPPTYKAPGAKTKHPHGTFYQVFHGTGAAFEGKVGIGIADITDGTSNTILIVEAAKDVPWTKPEDLPFVAGKPLPKLGGVFPNDGFNAAFADGSVRFFKSTIKELSLEKMITRNGGEVLDPDE